MHPPDLEAQGDLMRVLRITLLVLMVSPLAFAADSPVNLQPGKYEVATAIEMTMNGNSKTYPSQTTTRCVTAAQLSDPEEVFNERVAGHYRSDPSCTRGSLKTSSDSISYDEDCNNRTVHVEATYSSTSYSAVRKVLPKDPRAPHMTYKITGKRTGDCTK
jgi:Protein of unknown function (DUF3617)